MKKPKEASERLRRNHADRDDRVSILDYLDSLPDWIGEWPADLTGDRLEELADCISGVTNNDGWASDALRALAAIAPERKKRMVNLWIVGNEFPIAKPSDWAPRAHELWRKVGGPFEIEG